MRDMAEVLTAARGALELGALLFFAVFIRFTVQYVKHKWSRWQGAPLYIKGLVIAGLGALGAVLETALLGVPWDQAVRDALAASSSAVAFHEMAKRKHQDIEPLQK